MTAKLIASALLLLLVLASCATPALRPAGYRLAWSDDFNGSSLNTNKWVYWLPGKRRDAVNVTNAVSVANGFLTLTTFTRNGTNYTGMISTLHRFERVRGYWEARIRFEDSPGAWSAFWLQSSTMGHPIGDTAKAGIEIDVCEHRALGDKGEPIAGKVQHTLHWDGYGRAHKSQGHLTPDLGLASGFHLYGFEWTDSRYNFYVDGKLTWTTDKAISAANEFVILSSEIKNRDWAGNIPAGGYGDLARSQTKMIVDYVRYYSKVP